ncbi:hypothetical protein BM221_008234 [Beauveria bassiana]|uniref:Uncharacterized protein n=1 Tax=Beauveria bassiana TaxID=176275 RepID=A0A2N6NFI2_BEABA|nr:hypothetical protein BM221_008234 [Beauveria bassiana]
MSSHLRKVVKWLLPQVSLKILAPAQPAFLRPRAGSQKPDQRTNGDGHAHPPDYPKGTRDQPKGGSMPS